MQIVFELAYSVVIEGLCYGTGYFILRAFGFRKFERHDYAVGMVGFLFWFIVSFLVWYLLSV